MEQEQAGPFVKEKGVATLVILDHRLEGLLGLKLDSGVIPIGVVLQKVGLR